MVCYKHTEIPSIYIYYFIWPRFLRGYTYENKTLILTKAIILGGYRNYLKQKKKKKEIFIHLHKKYISKEIIFDFEIADH